MPTLDPSAEFEGDAAAAVARCGADAVRLSASGGVQLQEEQQLDISQCLGQSEEDARSTSALGRQAGVSFLLVLLIAVVGTKDSDSLRHPLWYQYR